MAAKKPLSVPGLNLEAGSAFDAMLAVWSAPPNKTQDFSQYNGDPVRFCEEVLGVNPWAKQREILESVVKHRRVAVRAGHGVGKTFILACLVLYWLYAHRGMVKSTAPSRRMTEELLWGEIHSIRAKALIPLPALRETLTSLVVDPKDRVSAEGFTSSKESKGTGSQGQHHARLLVIIDEAYAVHEMFWQPLLSQASGEQNRAVFVGNPTDPSAPAAKYDRSGEWHRIRINCLDHPNIVEGREVIEGAVSRQYIDEVRNTFGEDSAVFACRVLGEYPAEDEDEVLVPLAKTLACIRPREDQASLEELSAMAEMREQCMKAHPLDIGGDIGRTRDATVLTHRYGPWIEKIEVHHGMNGPQIVGRFASMLRGVKDAQANIDGGGPGGPIIDTLRDEHKLNAVDVQFGGAPDRDAADRHRYDDERARMLWNLRVLMFSGEISLPPGKESEMLANELAATKWFLTGGDKIRIIKKSEIKSDIGRSTDVADSMALACRPSKRRKKSSLVAA